MSESLKCENCDALLGRLADAFVWLDKPACKACFRTLSATRNVRYRGIWMPVAIVSAAAAVALAIVLALQLRPASTPGPGTDGANAGMSRAELSAILGDGRQWYTRWENPTKDNPIKFTMAGNGKVKVSGGDELRLEQRWLLVSDGHCTVPRDGKNLQGFYIPTGRQVDMFTEQEPVASR